MPLSTRPKPHRDARLFVLALEGEESGEEYRYFEALCTAGLIDTRRLTLQLVPTPRETHGSSPRDVLERACGAINKEPLTDVWLIVDVDTWSDKMLKAVCQQAHQRDFKMGISNPCFELWLFLHVASEDDLENYDAELSSTTPRKRSQFTKASFRRVRRESCATREPMTATMLRQARKRAKELSADKNSGVRGWPRCPGTFVSYLIDEFERAGLLIGD